VENSKNPQEEDWVTTMNRYKDHWQITQFSTSKGNSIANEASSYVRIKPSLNEYSGVYQKQQELSSVIKQLFPKAQMIADYTNPSLVYSDTKRPFSLNCYLPEYKLAFEVIEDPNTSCQYSFGAEIPIYTFNKAKRTICERNGITVLQVPSWWDSKASPLSHLINAIKRTRPDIVLENQKPQDQVPVTQTIKKEPSTEMNDKEEKESHVENVERV